MRTITISVAEAVMDSESAAADHYVHRSLAHPWMTGSTRLETSEATGFIHHYFSDFACRCAVVWQQPPWRFPLEEDVHVGIGIGSALPDSYLEASAIEERSRCGLKEQANLNFIVLATSHKGPVGLSMLLPVAARVIAAHPSACAVFDNPEVAIYSAGRWQAS